MSIDIVKAQARVLRTLISTPHRKISQSEALNILAGLAGWAHWNAYQPVLLNGAALPPASVDRLQALLQRRGVIVDSDAAKRLVAALADASRALPPAWDEQLRQLGGTATLFQVRDGQPAYSAAQQGYLEAQEDQILWDLQAARPGVTYLLGEEQDVLLLLALLHDLEGSGFLAELRDRSGQTRWIYVTHPHQITLLATLHAAALDAPSFAAPGETDIDAGIRRSQLRHQRTLLIDASGELTAHLRRLRLWSALWMEGHGLEDRLEQLARRHPPTFPWHSPPTADDVTCELDLLDRAEYFALQARRQQLTRSRPE